MVETYCRNPELVNMVKQSQRGNPKYHFLYEESSLNPYFQWRVNHQPERQAITSFERSMANANAVRPMPRPFCPPPVPPPEAIAGMRNENPAAAPQSAQKAHHLYHKLPAGLMLKLINEDHTPYSALRTRDLESTDFLDSVAPGLSSALSCTEKPIAPEMTSDLEQALDHFERGLCYIYKEGEFEDRDNPFASAASNDTHNVPSLPIMDKEGWESGVLEKLLWDRRRGGEERRKWKRKGDRAQRRLAGEDVSSSSQSSDDSDGSDSSSDSSGSDSSSASSSGSQSGQRTSAMRPSVNARGSSINTAIGSDNVGFKLLAKLGWQEGQGLGASNDGIIEPIRLQTRFSTIRNDKGKGSYRGRQRSRGGKKGNADKRASLGTGRLEDADATSALAAGSDQTGNNTNSKEFDAYRRQMSLAYSSHQNPPTSDDA
ncbi:hypothetical protein IW140_002936 [Coemansia sp. RSA 1813]|nr:SURP and G-patch domain-containing protein 1 [Coemansia sp. RSA 1646]KAJ1771959.1 hypothetical protein LPJ74_001851 [Coemansia sp. RSA 1843]KAJ2089731.1 hypothetical protein IW138_003187 [Coemansia sp. RSA 986]KAJ2214264.1 hypothetical protein EV179_003166 [Coemansia sp. RSA 487]KAJ2569682.1 hypothetical protein IW140_002936 [Coemansia sp. RSA 1813]